MAWSGLLVLVVKCVGKFSLLEGGLIFLLSLSCFLLFSTIMKGFGIHREYKDSSGSSDLVLYVNINQYFVRSYHTSGRPNEGPLGFAERCIY